MSRRNATRPTRRAGYTLVELIAVMVLVSIAAASVAPVMGVVERSRQAGAKDEIERRLLMVRSHAMTTGRPSGVRFDLAAQTAGAYEILAPGGAPVKMAMQGGDESAESMFAGVEIVDADLDPADAYDTIWFAHDGTPHYRTGGGAMVGGLTQDAAISVTGGGSVTVRMVSGAIE